MKTAQRRKDAPLAVKVVGDRLTVEIGIDTLAFAFEEGDWNNPFNDAANDFQRKYRIGDKQEFANDVRHAMRDEAEDGSHPLSRFLDAMFVAAVEDGSIGVEEII